MAYANISSLAATLSHIQEAAHAQSGLEPPMTSNAQAWRRLAGAGYHQMSEMLRAQNPQCAPAPAGKPCATNPDNPLMRGFHRLSPRYTNR